MPRLAKALGLVLLVASLAAASGASAQQRRQGEDERDAQRDRQRDSEWNQEAPPLPQLRNAGPCPYVKVLYDAGRIVEFQGAQPTPQSITYTGEIEGVSAGCAYKDAEPIRVQIDLLFSLGRGPQATSNQRNYRYWVAVTDRNRAVLAKEYFDLPVTFTNGQDRVNVNETLGSITIPRAALTVSGANFEILIGFDVTPEQAAFNRSGSRFRVNAGSTAATAAPPAGAPSNP